MNGGQKGMEEKWHYAPFYQIEVGPEIHFLGHREQQ